MFNNIGGKIKGLAKFVCWMGILSSIFVSFPMMASKDSPSGLFIGLIVLIGGCLLSWIGSFFTYGFGELISRAASIDDKLNVLGIKPELGNTDYADNNVYENKAEYQESDINTSHEVYVPIHEEGKCDICGAEVNSDNTNERLYQGANYSVCSECAHLLDMVNDEWISGNKRNKALDELKNRFEK